MTFRATALGIAVGSAAMAFAPAASLHASSHMDAPLITFDDAANTTDVYAFISKGQDDDTEYLTTALSVYPFEEPGIGPNNYRFDDRVRYEIHVALDGNAGKGRKDITYRFEFKTDVVQDDTIRQAFLGLIEPVTGDGQRVKDRFDANQNLRQTYRVTKIDHRTSRTRRLGRGIVPPNNQGLVTPFYNRNDDGEMPAKGGVGSEAELDPYTRQAITELRRGYRAFAGQRNDAFYADIQSIFDLDFSFGSTEEGGERVFAPGKPFDSQGGFNVHTIVLNIPLGELDGAKIAGVYATTSRDVTAVAGRGDGDEDDDDEGETYVQVGRQGNPLFAEALVAQIDKDLYNQTEPTVDAREFAIYAQDPDTATDTGIEIARLLNLTPPVPGLVESIFIPDLIRVDLTTGPARLAGQPGFNRLSGVPEVVGGDTAGADVLVNEDGEVVFGGWPNGRRFGDDVVDIALIAVGASTPFTDEEGNLDFDGVTENDVSVNRVFPYAATPSNGRVHGHHGESAESAF